nr:hypothetical protein [Actinomycetota bacterium]
MVRLPGPFRRGRPNSEFRYNGSAGVLFMSLHDSGYDWQFKSETGMAIDSGAGTCS